MFGAKLANKVRNSFSKHLEKPAAIEYTINDPARDIPPLSYWAGADVCLRLNVPTSLLCMQGAFAYRSPNHPFIAALRDGPSALRQFYQNFQPTNLRQMYHLPTSPALGDELPPWELPWLMLPKRNPPPGESGLGPEHGVSYYGPATEEKVDVEYLRLTKALYSIQHKGYQPDKHGDIEGHFLRRGNEYRFFVRGGKHRTAVLVSLGHATVPVRIRTTWPRVIDASMVSEWPLVHSGLMAESVALAIHARYFDNL